MIYALTSPKWEGEIKLEYYSNGVLKSAQLPDVFDVNSLMYFVSHFPAHISVLQWLRTNTKVKVLEMLEPITFEAYWEAYDKKTGSKELARQYWEGEKRTINKRPITVSDRMSIMQVVKRYTARYRGEKKEFQPLASSFLHQRQWEAESETAPRVNEAASNAAKSLLEKWDIKKTTDK